MASIKYIQDKAGSTVYPVTHERAVRDSNGTTLESKLQELESKTYIVAWDGVSTPTVANIPAGVTVTYSSTTYTGTLAASSSTIGKIYLVSDGNNEYDRYITSQSGNSYSWVSLGPAAVSLEVINDLTTGGATKALSAEQGKLLGKDVERLDYETAPVLDQLLEKTVVDPSSLAVRDYYINTSTGKYTTNTSYKHSLVSVTSGGYVILQANSNQRTIFSFLKSNAAAVSGETPDFSDEYASSYVAGVPIGERRTIRVPSDAKYLYVYRGLESTYPWTPTYIETGKAVDIIPSDEIDGINSARSLSAGLIVDSLEGYTKDVVDFSTVSKWPYAILTDGTYATSTNYVHTRLWASPGDIIRVKSASGYSARVAFFSNLKQPLSGGSLPLVSGTVVHSIASNKEAFYVVPEGTACVAVYLGSTTGYPYTPASMSIYHKKVEDQPSVDITPINSGNYRKVSSDSAIAVSSIYQSYFVKTRPGYVYYISWVSPDSGFILWRANLTDYPEVSNDSTSLQQYSSVPSGTIALEVTSVFGYLLCYRTDYFSLTSLTVKEVPVAEFNNSVRGKLDGTEKALANGLQYKELFWNSMVKRNYIIQSYGVYGTSATYKHVLIPVTPGQFVRMTKGANSVNYAWLTSAADPVAGGVPAFIENGTICYVSGAEGTEATIKVPDGASYMYVYLGGSGYPYAPTSIFISSQAAENSTTGYDNQVQTLRHRIASRADAMGLKSIEPHAVDANGWEIPQTVQQLNAIKKAMQLRGIKWTPLQDLPGKNDPDAHKQGVQQTSIPYSGNWHDYKYVGIEVSLHTFMTAVHNPYSLLYTENVSAADSKSAWGKTYYNTNGTTYYGTVCCGLTSGVVGQPTKYGNGVYPKVARTSGIFVPIWPQRDVNALQIGDVADNSAHSLMIMGLHRDANDNVDKVKIVESTSSVQGVRYVTYNTPADFYAKMDTAGDPFCIYRVTDLYKNIEYTPSPYVPLTEYGEQASTVVYNDDICCFAGDEACFMVGNTIAVNYNLTANPSHTWTAIEVYKDEVLLNTYLLSSIDQSSLDETQKNHALPFGTTLTAGKYKARMTDGTNYSDYTYWEVLPNPVSVTDNHDGSYTIKGNSSYPIVYVYCVRRTEATGGGVFYSPKAGREPDWLESQKDEIRYYYDEQLTDWGYDSSITNHIRVAFKGDYGIVTTPPILLPGRGDEGEEGDSDPDDDQTDS